jgi:hypothetical protein
MPRFASHETTPPARPTVVILERARSLAVRHREPEGVRHRQLRGRGQDREHGLADDGVGDVHGHGLVLDLVGHSGRHLDAAEPRDDVDGPGRGLPALRPPNLLAWRSASAKGSDTVAIFIR